MTIRPRRPALRLFGSPKHSLRHIRRLQRTPFLQVELLEGRIVLSPTIILNPSNDEFGTQIQTLTQLGDSNRITMGILDTGASPMAVSPDDQAAFADVNGNPDPIPIKVPGGANSDGIGGGVNGDVSKPITVLTDGLHAGSLGFDPTTFSISITANFTASSARVKNIQAFVGTPTGSPDLPTISGTPIFAGGFNSSSSSKIAAKVDLINGIDFYGIGYLEPDVHFVNSTTKLTPGPKEQLATIALTNIGSSNVSNPGNNISNYFNYASNTAQLNLNGHSVSNQKMLLDTGSELTIISTAEATALHIDMSKPFDTIDVQGVGGTETINGFVLDSLKIGLLGGGTLTITHVPVFVLDIAPGFIDGLLGMNLWDNIDQMLVNPNTVNGKLTTPSLSITWDPNYTGGSGGAGGGFFMNGLSSHRQHPTLNELLGGAARDFQVPVEPSAPHVDMSTPFVQTPRPQGLVAIVNTTGLSGIQSTILEHNVPAMPSGSGVSFSTVSTVQIPPAPSTAVHTIPAVGNESLARVAGFLENNPASNQSPSIQTGQETDSRNTLSPSALEGDPLGDGPVDSFASSTALVEIMKSEDNGYSYDLFEGDRDGTTQAPIFAALGFVFSGYWLSGFEKELGSLDLDERSHKK